MPVKRNISISAWLWLTAGKLLILVLLSVGAQAEDGEFTVLPTTEAVTSGGFYQDAIDFPVAITNTYVILRVSPHSQFKLSRVAAIALNGKWVIGPHDLLHNELPVERRVSLQEENTLDVKIAGRRNRGLTVELISAWDGSTIYSREFVLDKGALREKVSFTAELKEYSYILRLENGFDDIDPAAAAGVTLNGEKIFTPFHFMRNQPLLEREIVLEDENHLDLWLAWGGHTGFRAPMARVAKPERNGGFFQRSDKNQAWLELFNDYRYGRPWGGERKQTGFRFTVVGIDETPPEIEVATDIESNEAGWFNHDLTVSFNCYDDFSGVAPEGCPSPQTVTVEVEGLTVEGIATDRAGNTTSTSLLVKLDKTPPGLTASIAPEPSSYGWYNRDVTIEYQCTDNLSGVAQCPQPVLLQEEGKDQWVKAKALDIAGNSAQLDHMISLDKTEPVIEITPAEESNAHGWYSAPVAIEYACDDALSGVASCSQNRTISTEGTHQRVYGEARDKAGNHAEASIFINIDLTPPHLALVSPKDGGLTPNPRPRLTFIPYDNLQLADTLVVEWQRESGPHPLNCSLQGGMAVCLLPEDLAPGVTRITARVSDQAGNLTQINTSFALDSDNDQVADHLDQCTFTPETETADDSGCSFSQRDDDSDGIPNGVDQCLNTAPGTVVETDGCDVSQRDSDGDGVIDIDDPFPEDATESLDTDGDGIGDNSDNDMDGDGFSNAEELDNGSDPLSATDYPALQLITFTASQESISAQGQSVTLQWLARGALSVSLSSSLDNNIRTGLGSGGSLAVTPPVTAQYTLTLQGPDGQLSQTLEVDVQLPAPAKLWPAGADTDLVEESVSTSLLVTEDGTSYLGAYDNHYYRLSPNGQREWQIKNVGVVMAPAALHDDRLYIGADTHSLTGGESGAVYALQTDKTELWHQSTDSAVIAAPVLGNDKATLYAISYQGQLYAMDSSSGELLWTWKLPGDTRVSATPTLLADRSLLIIHSLDGQLLAVHLGDGVADRLVWRREVSQ